MRLLSRLFAVNLVLLGHLGLFCMDYLDQKVSLQEVIATKDPEKIRKKVVSLWPEDLCTVYLLLNQSDKKNPMLEAVGAVDTSEGRANVEVRKQQAQALKDYLLVDVVSRAIEGELYADDAFDLLDRLAGSGVSGQWGIFGEATSQNAQDSVAILKSLIYNEAPKTFDAQYDDFWMTPVKRFIRYVYRRDVSQSMKNFTTAIKQDILPAKTRAINNLKYKTILGKKSVFGAGAVLCVVAAYAYTRFALDKDGQKLKHGETETEIDEQAPISNA
jgi:hypothetical protein